MAWGHGAIHSSRQFWALEMGKAQGPCNHSGSCPRACHRPPTTTTIMNAQVSFHMVPFGHDRINFIDKLVILTRFALKIFSVKSLSRLIHSLFCSAHLQVRGLHIPDCMFVVAANGGIFETQNLAN
jgi:hypothetical protein